MNDRGVGTPFCLQCGGKKLKEKYKFCSKSCTATARNLANPKNGFAGMSKAKRSKFYAKRSKSDGYKATRTESFDKINARLKTDPEYAQQYYRQNTAARMASPAFRKASAANLNRLRKDPEVEARRRFAVADACRGRNFGKPNKCIPTKKYGVQFRSWHEALYATCLTKQKIKWQFEPKTFAYRDGRGKLRHYIPDFCLPLEERYVEIKGFNIARAAQRLRQVQRTTTISLTMITAPEVRALALKLGVTV